VVLLKQQVDTALTDVFVTERGCLLLGTNCVLKYKLRKQIIIAIMKKLRAD